MSSVPAAPKGSLRKSIIRERMHAIVPSVRACFECALDRDAKMAAATEPLRISAKFVIGPSGRVLAAQVERPDPAPQVSACLLGVVGGIRFPPPDGGGIVVVTYPWVLETD